jgi:phosphatidylglycerophosphatase A
MAQGVLGYKGPKKEAPPRNTFVDGVVGAFASAFYLGYTPIIPGTAGAALGVFLYWSILLKLQLNPLILFFLYLAIFIFGGFICTLAMTAFTEADYNLIVMDKALGAAIAVSSIPKDIWTYAFPRVLVAFLIFRLIEITKLFPLNQLTKLPKGWGMMADDVAGGIMALLVIQFAIPESVWQWFGWVIPAVTHKAAGG